MKKLALCFSMFVAALFASPAMAGGTYDGIWQISGASGYQIFYGRSDGGFVSVSLSPNAWPNGSFGAWSETGLGSINGNVAKFWITNADGSVKLISATFTSPTTATIVVDSCVGAPCAGIAPGATMQASKIAVNNWSCMLNNVFCTPQAGISSTGLFDGVWQVPGDSTYQVFYDEANPQSLAFFPNGAFSVVSLVPGKGLFGGWVQTGIGTISDGQLPTTSGYATFTLSNADGSVKTIQITFTSATSGTVLVTSCKGPSCANIPVGQTMQINKVY